MRRASGLGVIGTFVWDVDLRPRSALAAGRGVGRHRLRAERARCGAAGRLGDRADHQGRRRSRAARARVHRARSSHIAPDAALIGGALSRTIASSCATTTTSAAARCSRAACRGGAGSGSSRCSTRTLDALYINFLSGWELDLETTQLHPPALSRPDLLRPAHAAWRGAAGRPAHAAAAPERRRVVPLLRPAPDERGRDDDGRAGSDGARRDGDDGRRACLAVTLGKRGAVYFAAPGFDRLADLAAPTRADSARRSARCARRSCRGPRCSTAGDPTGCGDVWGATYFSRLLAGDNLAHAMRAAHRAAARNVEHRGATGLARHLRGELSLT